MTFRVTEDEYKKLEALSLKANRLISAYCRDCVFNKNITVITVINGIDDLVYQLRHIGNNLNQLTWNVNQGYLTAVNLEETKQGIEKMYELLSEKMKGK